MTYRETIPTRLRVFGRTTLWGMLICSFFALWFWQVALGLFIIVEFLTFLAIMNSTRESIQDVGYETPGVFGLTPRGITASIQMLIFLTAILAWARAINTPIDQKELLWIIGGEVWFAVMSYLFGKLVN